MGRAREDGSDDSAARAAADGEHARYARLHEAWAGPTREQLTLRLAGWSQDLIAHTAAAQASSSPGGRVEGTMNLDPRVAFYLEHKDQIDEWCRLRSELSPAAHRFFASCADPLRAAAQGLDGKPLTHVEIDCEYPKLLYYLPNWRGPGTVPARVAVGIEWVRHSVTFETAYSGIWVDCRHPEGSVVSARLEALVCDLDAAAGYVRRNQWFPAQRIEQPEKPDYWQNLDGFRDDIVASLARTWRVFAPLISRVVT